MTDSSDRFFPRVLGTIISQTRKSRKLSQTELAEQIGVSQSMLSRIEQGLATPDAVVFRRIAHFLELTSDELYQRVDEAMERAKKLAAATKVKTKGKMDWWDAAVAVLGVVGIASLIAVAVAAILENSQSD